MYRYLTSLLLALAIAFGATSFAYADHSVEEEEESHATTVHDEEEGSDDSAVSEAEQVEKMKALVVLLQKLIDALTHELEHKSGAISAHDEDDDHDEDEGLEDDNDENDGHDEDAS